LRKLFLSLSLLGILSLASAAHADTTVGTFQTGNCLPFLCNNNPAPLPLLPTSQTIDQQVYSAAAYSGTQDITGLTFYFAQEFGGPTSVLDGQGHGGYFLYLSKTSAQVGALSTNPVANRGANPIEVGAFAGGVSADPSFTINLSTPFLYNPADGNLLLEIFAFNQPQCPQQTCFGSLEFGGADVTSRALGFGHAQTLSADAGGLVTTFDTTARTPEPAPLVLLVIGVPVLFAIRRSIQA
jgi:hypothetical protein